MATRKYHKKSKKSNKRFRKTRSKPQRGGNQEELDKQLLDAIEINDVYAAEQALNNGADAKSDIGNMALTWASEYGHTEIVAMLLEKGADVNAKDEDGWTALYWASFMGHTETVAKLLEKGADVNEKNDGNTALQSASWNGHIETVAKLLENGAIVNMKNDDGDTALYWARKMGHTEIVKLLKQHIEKQTLTNIAIEQKYAKPTTNKQSVIKQVLGQRARNNKGETIGHPLADKIGSFLGGKRKSKRKSKRKTRKTRSKRGGSGKGNSNKRKKEEELPLPPSTSNPLPPIPPTTTSPSPEKISSNEKEEEIDTCPICLDDISEDDPSCKNGHHIHRKCLLELCQSQRFNKVLCPVCRKDITTKCIQAQEEEGDERRAQGKDFNSKNIFQYIKEIKRIIRSNSYQRNPDSNSIIDQLDYNIGRIWEIILNPMFDINVAQGHGSYEIGPDLTNVTLMRWLVDNRGNDLTPRQLLKFNEIVKPIIEYLLQRPNIIVHTVIVERIIAQNTELIPLFKKYKKIPKNLKSLI